MAQEAVFLKNMNGGVHNVPGEWVTQDKFGHPLVRGNAGFDYASEEDIEKWHDDQGLDSDVREGDTSTDDEIRPQIANMAVKDVPQQGNITKQDTAQGKK
jgi:hypothetical protein